MRLNLPRHNCIHFGILAEVTVSKENDAAIKSFMDQAATHTHVHEEHTHVAIFGSRSQIGGTTHRIRGSLQRSVDAEDVRSVRLSITNDRASDTLRRPPTSIKPVSHLIEASSRLFGSIGITCNSIFEYDESTHYRSSVRFPMPLMIRDHPAGITHIEQAQFSRRVNNTCEYRISVSENASSFTHSIDFEPTVLLNRKSIVQLFEKARAISSQLLIHTEGSRRRQ